MAIIYGTSGNDNVSKSLFGTGATDIMYGRGGHDWLYGRNGNDYLYGEAGNDWLLGENGNDVLDGGSGNDTLTGGSGNDLLLGDAGADQLVGGDGADTASYLGSNVGVMVYLVTGRGYGGHAEGDVLVGVEKLAGSYYGDILSGNDSANHLNGGSGADVLNGMGGNDLLEGGPGGDRLNGGAGADWAIYSTSSSGVIVNLATGQGLNGEAAGDVLTGIENLLGSKHPDTFYGNAVANVFWGEQGNDTLYGAGGRDRLWGGAGADTFGFASGSSNPGSDKRDVIEDFSRSQYDKIYVGPNGVSPTGGSLDFIGKSAFSGENQIRFLHSNGNTIVQVNYVGNKGAEMEIEIKGVVNLQASDFLL